MRETGREGRVDMNNMKMKILGCMSGALFLGLAGTVGAAGERFAILMDPGSTDRENRQMATRMERDLKNVLEKRGDYRARILRSADEFKADQDEYLLEVKIVSYNSGSKAARIIVGFGAGTATVNIHYELTNPRGAKVLSKEDGAGTSLDWQRLARKMNENILEAVQQRLARGDALTVEPGAPPPEPARKIGGPVSREVVTSPTAPVAPPPAASSPDPTEQLRKLEALKKEKLISDSEYKQKRKEILDRL
jgi:hypothetical protein